jgi:AcrR family transcriptional regulator
METLLEPQLHYDSRARCAVGGQRAPTVRLRSLPRVTESADVRVRRTRQRQLAALAELLLARPYDEITVQLVAARAGVGRSSLYEHFRGKRGLLAVSLSGPLAVLADTVGAADNTAALTSLLRHFWEHRARARGLFTGAMRPHAVAVLVRLIEERLRRERATLRLPRRLAAIQLAEALFAPLAAWLTSACACGVPQLACGLRRAALALRAALHSA